MVKNIVDLFKKVFSKIKNFFGLVAKKVLTIRRIKLVTASALVVVLIAGCFVGIAVLSPEKSQSTADMAQVLDDYFENDSEADIEDYLTPTVAEAQEEVSFYDSVAIAQVDTYVNVRSGPGTDFGVVGIIRNNCAATILGEENGWYQVQSGNVTGYILAEYFITGDAAEVKAREVGCVDATVTAQVLNVRDGQGADANIIATIIQGEVYDVVEYGDGWVYLNVDASLKGWVSMEYVTIDVKFATALTLEEEAARVAEEQRIAAAAAAEQSANRSQTVYTAPAAPYVDTADKAALRQAVVDYAYQFAFDPNHTPYVGGGNSLVTGTDCSGFTMLIYQAFGYSLPRSSSAYQSLGGYVHIAADINQLLPGDILYRSGQHVAIYIGNGQVVHASNYRDGVKIAAWNYSWWSGAVRVIN